MLLDLEVSKTGPDEKADVCILGAGAAGIVLALELAKKGRRVLVLEGGGLELEEKSQDIYRSEIAAHSHNGIHTGRNRYYGGTTTKWGGQILELFPEDFSQRAWIRKSGWPFSKETLSGYYARAIECEGLQNATLRDEDVWRQIGLETPDLGTDLIPYFSRWCPEPNFARLHGRALIHETNPRIFLHANACELLFEADRQTVVGVRARTMSGKEAIFCADQFVVCLGGIESCRFLLQPHAEGRAPWLANDLLGRHFQDHTDSHCGEITVLDRKRFHACFDNVFSRGYKYQPRFRLAVPRQTQEKILNVAGVMFFSGETEDTLNLIKVVAKRIIRRHWNELTAQDLVLLVRHFPLLLKSTHSYKFRRRMYNPASSKIMLGVSCEQEPSGESRITLSPERDALGLFRTRLDWRISDLELYTIQTFVRTAQQFFADSGLGTLVPNPDLFSNPERFIAQAVDSNHHMGGARMATSSAEGVVDPDLRLHGTTNAYVCSSAVFPTSGFSNPTHTLLALSVRLADHLATH